MYYGGKTKTKTRYMSCMTHFCVYFNLLCVNNNMYIEREMQRDTNLYVRTYMVKKYFLNDGHHIYDGNNFYEVFE